MKTTKDKSTEDIIDEVSEAQFAQASTTSGRAIIDYETVWNQVAGKIVTNNGLTKLVNNQRVAAGFPKRQFYYSERQRVFEGWEAQGRKIERRTMIVNKRRLAVFKFME